MSNRRFIPVARPSTGAEELAAVERVLKSGWLAQGPECEAFEAEFAAYVGAAHAVAASSGTAALHLALRALGIGPGDEVITVSYSFIATAASIVAVGAVPIFVDVEATTGNIDASRVEAALSPRTRVILCVHQLGMPCDLAGVLSLARRHGVFVVEDAACALGSEMAFHGEWQRIGAPVGEVACFSFHPRKTVATGEGGMLTTRDPDLAWRARQYGNHGASIAAHRRHTAERLPAEQFDVVGLNYRLSDIQAAIGRAQLRKLDGFVARRRALAQRYRAGLAATPGLSLPAEPVWARSNWQSFAVQLDAPYDPNAVMQSLRDQGIATRPGVHCVHREPAFVRTTWRAAGSLAVSEVLRARTIQLPMFVDLSEADQDVVIGAVNRACRP